jgi:hypothetical protein
MGQVPPPLRGFLAVCVQFLGLTPQAIACRPSRADIHWIFQHISHFSLRISQLQNSRRIAKRNRATALMLYSAFKQCFWPDNSHCLTTEYPGAPGRSSGTTPNDARLIRRVVTAKTTSCLRIFLLSPSLRQSSSREPLLQPSPLRASSPPPS